MFGLIKKSSQNQAAEDAVPLNFNQKEDFQIEDTSIHTMQEDLKNPNASHNITMGIRETKVPSSMQKNLSQKQKSSPFLADPTEKKTTSETIPETKQPQVSQKRNDKLDISSLTDKKKATIFHYNWRLIFFPIFSLGLLFILIWVGTNYSKNTPKKNVELPVTEPIDSENPPPKKEPIQEPLLSYSQTNPNYLRLENTPPDAEKIKATFNEYIQKVFQEGYASPIEFIPTDTENKAFTFQAFFDLLGLKFSPALTALLGENFSLFIYNDITAPRIGFAIESKDDINLAEVLLQEEKNLADEINLFFFTKEYQTEKDFADSTYGTIKIRYQNIISPDILSVDYAIYENKFLLGTTKSTLRSIIDKLNTAKKESIPETITPEKPTDNSSN